MRVSKLSPSCVNFVSLSDVLKIQSNSGSACRLLSFCTAQEHCCSWLIQTTSGHNQYPNIPLEGSLCPEVRAQRHLRERPHGVAYIRDNH
jgi:hypothetical protein